MAVIIGIQITLGPSLPFKANLGADNGVTRGQLYLYFVFIAFHLCPFLGILRGAFTVQAWSKHYMVKY